MSNRRQFIALISSAAAWPLSARAQRPERMRRVGVLLALPTNDVEGQARLAAFRDGLRQLGWVEGRNITIDVRYGPSNTETRQHATELVALTPEVILANGLPPRGHYSR